MPTYKSHPTYTALIIFADGETKSITRSSPVTAQLWIASQLHQFGGMIIATDVFDNSQHVLQVEA